MRYSITAATEFADHIRRDGNKLYRCGGLFAEKIFFAARTVTL